MIERDDLGFLENVFSLQPKTTDVDLFFLRAILTAMRDNEERSEDIKDSFSRNQYAAKEKLVGLLDQIGVFDKPVNAVIFGCWYGSVIIPMLTKKKVKSIVGIDQDEDVIRIAKNKFWANNEKVELVNGNVFGEYRKKYEKANLFINTSCEHMPPMKDWPFWSKLRHDTYFAFQSNNMYGIEGHINCVKTIEDFKDQLPEHAEVLLQDELEDERGTRFTLVGRIFNPEHDIVTPDLVPAMITDSFRNNHFRSKQRLVSFLEKNKILDRGVTSVTVFGGWNGSLVASFLSEKVKDITLIDGNNLVLRNVRNQVLSNYKNIDYIFGDAFSKSNLKRLEESHVIINTACEHMPSMKYWPFWKKMKPGTYVAFQSNNIKKDGHTNAAKSLEDFKNQLPSNLIILYDDEIRESFGDRYTIVGMLPIPDGTPNYIIRQKQDSENKRNKLLSKIKGFEINNETEVVVFGAKSSSKFILDLASNAKRVTVLDLDNDLTKYLEKDIFTDLNNVDFIHDNAWTKDASRYKDAGVFINTICEHMPPMKDWQIMPWFQPGTYVVFESNNNPNELHTNGVGSLKEFREQLPKNIKVLAEDDIDDLIIVGKILEGK